MLRTDQSVQVEEDLSGKKVIGIRGGNPDEVVVLYNGIKLNSAYNNIFDLALIDLEDVQRFEIIKGSNTSLYGPEAFAGVVNIVPKMQLDYHLRFQQRFGTYRSGNWGIHLNPQNWLWKTERLRANYNYTRGALKRRLSDVPADRDNLLRNTSSHHSAMLMVDAGQENSSIHGQMIALFMQTRLGYENQPYDEHLDNLNSLYSLRYSGRMAVLHDATLSVSYKNLQEKPDQPEPVRFSGSAHSRPVVACSRRKHLYVSPVQVVAGISIAAIRIEVPGCAAHRRSGSSEIGKRAAAPPTSRTCGYCPGAPPAATEADSGGGSRPQPAL
ncbi:MAG: TonB-dependent receptor plug domain-containing protein [candidate division KSB1 bacterium]|nr:TonB-dependent receptor plug domain-containing protein [candidate division KSB1 bacterium]